MEIWLVSFIGGFVGSIFMDITEEKMAKAGISSGVTGAYVGRWAKGLLKGVVWHRNIADGASDKNELLIGKVFHYVVGGGVVALFYPIFLYVVGSGDSSNHLLLASIFGLFTSVLPWFVLMPSFGWGLFGQNAPHDARTIISPILSHIPYGFGIGLTLSTYYAVVS